MIAALSWADLIVVVLAFVLGFCIGYVVRSTGSIPKEGA